LWWGQPHHEAFFGKLFVGFTNIIREVLFMSWLKKLLFGRDGIEDKKKDEQIRKLQMIIEQNNQTMEQMNSAVKTLENSLSTSREEVAVAIHSEIEKYTQEEEYRRKAEEERKKKEHIQQTEKIISVYLAKYLDKFVIINNRFSLNQNSVFLNNTEDLMFKIAQMFKLGKEGIDHVVLWENHIIKLEIYNEDHKIYYSLDNGENLCSEKSVGIKFLRKFIDDIQLDILNLPCVKTSKIYKVEGKNYKYVLANNEKECYYLLKDREMKTAIEEVDFVEDDCFVRSIKSNLIYRN
jgi:hypothetical protein